jgi:hypothetical protein
MKTIACVIDFLSRISYSGYRRFFHGLRNGVEAVNNPFKNTNFFRSGGIQHSYNLGTVVRN